MIAWYETLSIRLFTAVSTHSTVDECTTQNYFFKMPTFPLRVRNPINLTISCIKHLHIGYVGNLTVHLSRPGTHFVAHRNLNVASYRNCILATSTSFQTIYLLLHQELEFCCTPLSKAAFFLTSWKLVLMSIRPFVRMGLVV